MKQTTQKGFTLLEILLVVAAIAILAGIVIIAINPSKQLADTRNAQRHSDINSTLNAVYQYAIDHNGALPAGTSASSSIATATSTGKEICTNASSTVCANLNFVDLNSVVLNQKYLVGIPVDPNTHSTDGAGYYIWKSANNRVTVEATNAEGDNGTFQVSK
jgi:prepilin-type N-terminal cleavage/methylation domain-containing protein